MNVSVEFNKHDFSLKDQDSKEILFFGIINNGLCYFTLDLHHQYYTVEISEDLWNRRLGHHSKHSKGFLLIFQFIRVVEIKKIVITS